ncbi:MAG: DsbA family oxidoreductase [Rhodobacteraceae bacterium]|nr:DsbA family oxidoreductase [Paracoccaceae bacterium]
MIPLDIVADIACPWCRLGRAALDLALAERPGHPFAIAWHPFRLDPDLPPGGMDRQAWLAARFGGRDAILRAHAPLLERAAGLGVEFDLPAIGRAPQTLDAHRLILWAGLEGRQDAVVGRLFDAYWAEGRDIGDHATLAALAGEAGLDPALVRRLLEGTSDRDLILAREAHSRERGIGAVPTFVVAGRHVLQGLQPPELWIRVIDELAAREVQA